jgi:hypothetical protein
MKLNVCNVKYDNIPQGCKCPEQRSWAQATQNHFHVDRVEWAGWKVPSEIRGDVESTDRSISDAILNQTSQVQGCAEAELKEGRVATRRSRPIVFLSSSLKFRYVPRIRLI